MTKEPIKEALLTAGIEAARKHLYTALTHLAVAEADRHGYPVEVDPVQKHFDEQRKQRPPLVRTWQPKFMDREVAMFICTELRHTRESLGTAIKAIAAIEKDLEAYLAETDPARP